MVQGLEHVGKQLSVVLWGKNNDGEEEAITFSGGLIYDGDDFLVDRSPENAPFRLIEDWVSDITAMAGELAEIFPGSDLILQLTVGDLPGDVDKSTLQKTGFVWPKSK